LTQQRHLRTKQLLNVEVGSSVGFCNQPIAMVELLHGCIVLLALCVV